MTGGTAWRDSLRPASFRGVPFYVSSASASGGRRVNTLLYPERDDPDYEDMGRAVRDFSFTVYLLGDKAFSQRDKLIEACEKGGPGNLIHPYRGTIPVIMKTYSFTEAEGEALIIRGDLSCSEYKALVGVAVRDPQLTVFRRKVSLLEKILAWFEDAYDVARKPVTAIEKARDTLDKGLQVVGAAKAVTGTVPEFARTLRQIQGRVAVITSAPEIMAQDVTSLVTFGTDLNDQYFVLDSDNARDQWREMKAIQQSNRSPLVANSGELGSLIQDLFTLSGIAAEAGILTEVEFNSPEEAEAAEKDLVARVDGVLKTANPTDDLYRASTDMLTAVHEDLNNRAIQLPRLVEVHMDAPRNALEFSNEYYGSVDQVPEIVKMNGVIHPGFIDASTTVKLKVPTQ